jgi:asparagine synthetase B (glutamine-hydrolysing)
MQVKYRYKDKLFDDVREIILNNNLKPDWNYIFEEYLPFQIFISKRTFFKGLTLDIDTVWKSEFTISQGFQFNKEYFSNSIRNYISNITGKTKLNNNSISAVSGGIDSSVIALELKPKKIYSGYYNDQDYDETKYSKEIAQTIEADHYVYELTETDFLHHLEDYISAIGIPAAGLGGVMEFALLEKVISETPSIKQIVFGNGGDEIFMGYFFNHYIKNFIKESCVADEYMPNFLPSKKIIADKIIDFAILASINRGEFNTLYSSFSIEFLKELRFLNYIEDKFLHININIILPSLLHISQQICKSLNVVALNPLANRMLVKAAKFINSPISDIPKEKLRELYSDMPLSILKRKDKKGFPIPVHTWKNANKYMEEIYNDFFKRKEVEINKKPYDGINRWTWGIISAELILQNRGV